MGLMEIETPDFCPFCGAILQSMKVDQISIYSYKIVCKKHGEIYVSKLK